MDDANTSQCRPETFIRVFEVPHAQKHTLSSTIKKEKIDLIEVYKKRRWLEKGHLNPYQTE